MSNDFVIKSKVDDVSGVSQQPLSLTTAHDCTRWCVRSALHFTCHSGCLLPLKHLITIAITFLIDPYRGALT